MLMIMLSVAMLALVAAPFTTSPTLAVVLARNTALAGYSIVTVCGPTLAGAAFCFYLCWRVLPRGTDGQAPVGMPLQ